MSIIHDALKKTQDGLQARSASVIGQPLAIAFGGRKIIILVLLAAAALTAEYVYWPRPSLPKIDPPPAVRVNAVPAPQPEPKVEAKPELKAEAQPQAEPKVEPANALNIHGIMSNPKGNVVLIDNGIYAEGDEVQGVKIIKINLDGIVILRDKKEETIRVRPH